MVELQVEFQQKWVNLFMKNFPYVDRVDLINSKFYQGELTNSLKFTFNEQELCAKFKQNMLTYLCKSTLR